jgi:hypothetical protein
MAIVGYCIRGQALEATVLRAIFITAIFLTIVDPLTSFAAECCDTKSPYREGEGYAETPAECENLKAWSNQAPDFERQRVSMHVRGTLSGVHTDGTVVYLEMCEAKSLRVVCVTYQTNGMKAGDSVNFGGGLSSINDEWIKLDPCLASRD